MPSFPSCSPIAAIETEVDKTQIVSSLVNAIGSTHAAANARHDAAEDLLYFMQSEQGAAERLFIGPSHLEQLVKVLGHPGSDGQLCAHICRIFEYLACFDEYRECLAALGAAAPLLHLFCCPNFCEAGTPYERTAPGAALLIMRLSQVGLLYTRALSDPPLVIFLLAASITSSHS